MKTIKTKKSVGKAYVFIYSSKDEKQTSNSNVSKEMIEKSLEYYTSVGFKCSEISEVELFEEIEGRVPHVWDKYILWTYNEAADKATLSTFLTEEEAIEFRRTAISLEIPCSEIEHIRREF